MYSTLVRKIIRTVAIGTSLAVIPAVPFYIYTFDATPSQLVVLVPLFIPALLSMLFADLLMLRFYLKPVAEFCRHEESGRSLDDQRLYLAKQRALNFPVFAVLRVFVPHAIIGSGVYNLSIILANRYLSLGINPGDYAMYWVINLTVVPVAHAVYEYFELAKAMIPILEKLDSKVRVLPDEYLSRVVNVRLSTKVVVIVIMLGMAPLFILGVSLNKKHTSLLVEKEQRHLLHEAQLCSSLQPAPGAWQRQAVISLLGEGVTIILENTDGGIVFSDSKLDSAQRSEVLRFLNTRTHPDPYYSGERIIAAKAQSADGKLLACAAVLTDELTAESSSLRYGTISIIVASILLLGSLLILVAKDINQSTKKLVAGLKEVEEGSLSREVKIYSTDEFSTIGNGFNRMIAGLRERNFIKDTFGKYVAPTVMEKILHEGLNAGGTEGFRLSGERRTVTILISDIRDFTRRTEESSAEAIVDVLNRYLERMVSVVERYEGTVDKYIGDALMVLFGAPLAREDDPDRAVQAAFAMRAELAKLNEEMKHASATKFSPIRIGIGIHTGEVVAGSVGSATRLEYTVIGDAVNLSSRIEGLTKQFKTDILVSEATVNALKGTYPLTRMRRTKVKGKKGGVVVFKAGTFRQR